MARSGSLRLSSYIRDGPLPKHDERDLNNPIQRERGNRRGDCSWSLRSKGSVTDRASNLKQGRSVQDSVNGARDHLQQDEIWIVGKRIKQFAPANNLGTFPRRISSLEKVSTFHLCFILSRRYKSRSEGGCLSFEIRECKPRKILPAIQRLLVSENADSHRFTKLQRLGVV
jgi:hypothetical protein